MFREFDKTGFELLAMMLERNPAKRITAEEALNHEYFKKRPFEEPLRLQGERHEYLANVKHHYQKLKEAERNDNKMSLPDLG